MKKLALALAAIVVVVTASGVAFGQGRTGAPGTHVGPDRRGAEWVGVHRDTEWHQGNWQRSPHFRHGSRVGIYVGAPFWWGAWGYPFYAPFPVYQYPYSIYEPDDRVVYVQPAPEAIAAPPVYWYYCPDPAGYFPYVQSCAKAWMTVVPPRGPGAPNTVAPTQ